MIVEVAGLVTNGPALLVCSYGNKRYWQALCNACFHAAFPLDQTAISTDSNV